MKVLILILVVAYMAYVFRIRDLIIISKLNNPHGIDIDFTLNERELYERMRYYNFTYPGLGDYSFAGGRIYVRGHFEHEIILDSDNRLYVLKDFSGSIKQRSKFLREAEYVQSCISHFIDADTSNPQVYYKKLNSGKMSYIFVTCFAIVFIAYSVLTGSTGNGKTTVDYVNSKITQPVSSANISESYLEQYSKKVTVGQAFEKFFTNGKWKSYSIGIQKYVDFQGNCSADGKSAVLLITFSITDNKFALESMKLDGKQLSELEMDEAMRTIFSVK